MIKKLALIFIIVSGLILLFNHIIMPWYVKHSDLVKVPNVIGMNFLEAKRVLDEAGVEIKQGDVKYDETKPIGQIIDQNPPGEQMVKYGRRIYVTVCGGEQLVEVPRLVGRSIRDAKFSLEQRNLQLGETVKKFSDEFPEETVVSQIIQPGSKVKKSTKIDLIISNGPQIGDIIVPNLVGKTLDEAKKIISEKKLKTGKVTYQSSDFPPGQVVDQYPKKDKSAKENTEIALFVAKKKKVIEKDLEGEEEGLKNDVIKNKSEDTEKPKSDTKDKPEKKKEGSLKGDDGNIIKKKEENIKKETEGNLKKNTEKEKKEGTSNKKPDNNNIKK